MKIFRFFLFAAAFSAAFSMRADAPLIRVDDVETPPAVKETGRLLELRDPNVNNRENTPPGVLAALVAANGVIYDWSPSPDPMRVTGGADLVDAFLSPDESLLALFERTGGKEGPNATRVLCFNLLNSKLVRAFTVADRKLAAAAFVPGSTLFVAPQLAQEAFNQPDRLVAVDLRTGSVKSESLPFEQPVRSFAVNAERSFVTLEKSENILMIPHEAFEAPARQIRTLVREPELLLTPDGSRLVVYGNGRMELYNAAIPVPELLSSREIPEDFKPSRAIAASDDASVLVFLDPSGKAYLYAGGIFRALDGKVTGTGCCRLADRKLFLGIQQKEAVSLYSLPNEVEPQATCAPGELRPRMTGRNFRLFVRTSTAEPELILIDNRANIFELTVKPRRWQKRLLFEAAK
ncbi:MAG: hypothetical protein HPZ91_01785 [Lentisphaeria bacterium]|nr:hypothetical protein [Lentisphaeria bacterium]